MERRPLKTVAIGRTQSFAGDPYREVYHAFCYFVGGVISPLLTNIYLDKLDQFVEETLMPKYNRGQARQENPDYRKHLNAKWKAKQNGDRGKWVYHDKVYWSATC